MRGRGPFSLLIVGGDGRRLLSLRLDARFFCAILALAVGLGILCGAAGSSRRGPVTAAAALPIPTPPPTASPSSPVEDEHRAMLALMHQRLPEIEAEIAAWQQSQASIRKLLRVRSGSPAEPAPRAEGATGVSLLSNQLDRLLASVRAEAHGLRALEPFVAQAARALAGLPSRWPVRSTVTSEYGPRHSPWTGAFEFHEGIDIAASVGTRVVAPSAASVAFVGSSPEYGNTVVLDHGNDVRTRYGHLERAVVKVGEKVERGQPIALSGNTGHTTGPHLHYEVMLHGRHVNPRPYLAD